MIRVLQCVNDMHRAGLETMLMNYYRNIDRSKIQFDFLTHRPERSDYDDEIESLGGKMYYAPRLYPQNYPAYFKWTKAFFREHTEYKIVHSHIDAMSFLPLSAAKKAGVPYRIAHSHNTSIDRDFKYILKQYFRTQITKAANYYCACGDEAGEFLFPGKNFTIIPNAIETDKFIFNSKLREKKRKELNLENQFVVGHVGRLSYQKNHRLLVEIFNEILKKKPEALLLLVGVGEKEEEIKTQIYDRNISNKVKFLGNRNDVNELYQAMDVFVMPSFFEGVPVTGIEAQFAGLSCFFSDRVPVEVDFTGECYFYPLNMSLTQWADNIIKYGLMRDRKEKSARTLESRFDIENAHKILENYYLAFYRE